MRTQLTFRAEMRVLCSMFACCLLALAIPASAKAVDPSFDSATCGVQSVSNPPFPLTWQIKGTGSVKDIPAGYSAVSVKITFQKRVDANGTWSDVAEVN